MTDCSFVVLQLKSKAVQNSGSVQILVSQTFDFLQKYKPMECLIFFFTQVSVL